MWANRGFLITARNGKHSNSKFSSHPDHHTQQWQYLTASQEEKWEQDYCGVPEEKNHLEALGGGGVDKIIIILKWTLNKPDEEAWIEFVFCEHGNEHSGSIQRRVVSRLAEELFVWELLNSASLRREPITQPHKLVPELRVGPSLTS